MLPHEPETILIVEDDLGIAELEQTRLEQAGFRTVLAATAEAALEQLQRQPVALMLLDYRLPGNVDGLDLYARMKAAGYAPPVILVTGFSDEATTIKAFRAGVRDYVTKSAEYLDYLPEAVGRVLCQIRIEQKLVEAERALHEREQELTDFVENAPIGLHWVDAAGIILWANRADWEMLGYERAEYIGQPIAHFHADAAEFAEILRRLCQGEELHEQEARLRHKDGSIRHVLISSNVYRVQGEFVHTRCFTQDITEHKRAEQLLRQSETRNRALLNAIPDTMFLIHQDGTFLDYHVADADDLLRQPEQALGKPVAEFLPPEFAHKCLAATARALQSGQVELYEYEHPGHAEVRSFETRVVACGLEEAMVIVRNVTQRKQLERQFFHAQKMEAIGHLAGGVAHDFNNLLTVIIGFSEMILSETPPEESAYEILREIHKAGERASGLTRQLLAFSRRQILQPVILDLNDLVTEAEKMLRRLIGEDIVLEVLLDPDVARVKVDPGQIEQILVNLAVNSRDAMPTGGQLTIETQNLELDEFHALYDTEVRPGPYVLLAVSDTGMGIDAATRARIFEPFFTTKEVGKGTGLGLATVYGIVKQSGGHVYVYSEPGEGTTFKIYLPRITEAPTASRPGRSLLVPGGTETVLLAEDAPAARMMMRLALENFGYTVLEAQDGEEALRICRQHRGPLPLLITDVVMPGMSGRQLAEFVSDLRPDTRVLYLSGYTDDAVVRNGVLETEMAFLQKPVTPTTLARKVREVLDQAYGTRAHRTPVEWALTE